MFPGIWEMNFLASILRMLKVPVSSLGKKRRYSAWCFENSLVFWCQCKTKNFSKSKYYNLAIFLQTSLRQKRGYYEECSWTNLFVHNFNCCKSPWVFADIYPFPPCCDSWMFSLDFIIPVLCQAFCVCVLPEASLESRLSPAGSNQSFNRMISVVFKIYFDFKKTVISRDNAPCLLFPPNLHSSWYNLMESLQILSTISISNFHGPWIHFSNCFP